AAWCPRFASIVWTLTWVREGASALTQVSPKEGRTWGTNLTRHKLTQAEEDAGLATRHFDLAISARPLRFNLHHTHLAEGVMPKAAPLPIARVTRQPALSRSFDSASARRKRRGGKAKARTLRSG